MKAGIGIATVWERETKARAALMIFTTLIWPSALRLLSPYKVYILLRAQPC